MRRNRLALTALLLAILAGLTAYWWNHRIQAVIDIKPVSQNLAPVDLKPKPRLKPVYKAVPVPVQMKERVAMDQGFALGFAQYLCGVSYDNYEAKEMILKNLATKDIQKVIFLNILTDQYVKELVKEKTIMKFELTRPIKVVDLTDSLDEFWVEGVVEPQDGNTGKYGPKQPLAMVIGFDHGPGTSGQVALLQQVHPSQETIKFAQVKSTPKTGL